MPVGDELNEFDLEKDFQGLNDWEDFVDFDKLPPLEEGDADDGDDEDVIPTPKRKPEKYEITADPGQKLVRIDKFLHNRFANVSRTRVQDAIKEERVFVNNKAVKANYRVKPHDHILIEMPEPSGNIGVIPEDIPLDIVYEDDSLLVVNKPAGMVVHPGHNNWTGTLVNALAYRFNALPTSHNGEDKPGLVHRIDKDTSGLLLVAKTEFAMTHLARQFFDHSCERTYYALVWGFVEEDAGTIAKSIGRDPRDRRMRTVYEEPEYGKHAITHFKVLKRMRYVSLIQCNLETGRTHQIRVHLKYKGHPLFQDHMYGGDKILKGERTGRYRIFINDCVKVLNRQALHAKSLGFVHPVTKEWMQFDTELPPDMAQAIQMWEDFIVE